MDTLGCHVIAELDGCDPTLLCDPELIRRALVEAARAAGATLLAEHTFKFKDAGVSGFALLAESHISIHTWPEHAYAAVDIYTCGEHTRPELARDALAEWLGSTHQRTSILTRGAPTPDGGHDHRPGEQSRVIVHGGHAHRPMALRARAAAKRAS